MNREKICIAFGLVLRDIRKKRKISQEELALQTGIDRSYISILERGYQLPTIKTMWTLSDALEIPFGHFASLFAEKLKEFANN